TSIKMALNENGSGQVRVLTLNDGEHSDGTLHCVQKGWLLRFCLGPSLFGRRVVLYVNHPDEGQEFARNTYRQVPWQYNSENSANDTTAAFAQVKLRVSGAFHYYFVYDGSDCTGPQGSGFFTVNPELRYGDEEILPLDCIQCQTVLAKSLGPFNTWERKLKVAKESGYNMIHFTPIQELGGSNSSYSLSEQLKLNPIFNEGDKIVTIEDIAELITKMKREWKVMYTHIFIGRA
ncbi:unnamed protein product, partial [Timema podura]|nr:unnamed protein product [Timema podura]